MKKIIPIIISILLVSCFIPPPNTPTIIKGVVTNGITKEPIEGVEIAASEITGFFSRRPANPGKGTTFSKEDGSYLIELAASESAIDYDLSISKTNFCRQYIQTVEAGKTHRIDLELYKSATINLLYILNNEADSIVENITSKAGLGGCDNCFFIERIGDQDCFEEHPYGYCRGFSLNRRFGEEWKELEFTLEGIQGFDYYIYYELYNEKKLLKKDSLKYFLDEDELTIEITL